MKEEKKVKDIFHEGPIPSEFIRDSIAKHATRTGIGGHGIFLGQVRADEIDGRRIIAIEYSAYREMALERMTSIREDVFAQYPLACLHVHHSLGLVPAGELCLFVFTSSERRKPALDACAELVERIKAELPIWGKERFDTDEHQWKVNR